MQTGTEQPTSDTPTVSASENGSPSKVDTFAIFAVFAMVGLLAFVLAWPWLPQYSPQSPARNRYQPISHGQASTRITLGIDGAPESWATDNIVAIPAWELFGANIPSLLRDHILINLPELTHDGRYSPGTHLFRNDSRVVSREGIATDSESYILRRPERDEILALILPGIEPPLLYQPPLDLSVGDFARDTTVQSGIFGGIYTYTASTTQSQVGDIATPFGAWQECRQVIVDYALHAATQLIGQEVTTSIFCPERGSVVQTSTGLDGNARTTYTLLDLAENDSSTVSALLPPEQPFTSPSQEPPSFDSWQLNGFAQTISATLSSANSVTPLYVQAPHPYLLVATRGGPLRALDAQQTNLMLWRFQSAGSIFSQPSIDPATGYLYFGSSDKHLYALTGEALFLWRVPVRDNVAAQPLIVQSIVVVAAEDGSIYALDKVTGAEHWRLALGGATVASPAHFPTAQGDLIIVGGDDGIVNAVDSATGAVIWETPLDGAIQAPLRVDAGTLYVATTASALHALGADGAILWSADLLTAPRTAPAFDDNQLYLVDSQGWLYALARADGRIVWRSNQPDYLGPPILPPSSDLLLVASTDGTVSALSPTGQVMRQWHVAPPDANGDVIPHSFSLGPSFGGGALWMGDDHANIFRLGPPITVAEGR